MIFLLYLYFIFSAAFFEFPTFFLSSCVAFSLSCSPLLLPPISDSSQFPIPPNPNPNPTRATKGEEKKKKKFARDDATEKRGGEAADGSERNPHQPPNPSQLPRRPPDLASVRPDLM